MKKNRTYGLMEDIGLLKMIKIMRFTIFILFLSLSQAFAVETYSQQTKLSLDLKNAKVEDVLDKIEKSSEFFFMYNKGMVDVERKIDIQVEEKGINQILDKVFKNTGISYSIKDRQILLINNSMVNIGTELNSQQQKSISGKVTDSSGSPLPGVSVVVKGTTTGTIADFDGKYSLTNIPDNATLQFSFVGMKGQEIVVTGKTTINVTLAEESIGIDEVVAIGYGTMKRSSLTGSTSMMDAGKIEAFPSMNIVDAFQGKAAGVFVDPSELPGGGATIRIRGTRSLNATNEPLVIIDDVPGDLSNLNSSDIESVEVLKDASSTAIYGSQAANGVILVTTKKAKKSGIVVELNSYAGINHYSFIKMQSKDEYVNFIKNIVYARNYGYTDAAAWQNSTLTVQDALDSWSSGLASNYAAGNEFNWQSMMLDDISAQTGHHISISTKSEKSSSRLSYNYMYDKGYYKNNDFQKHILSYYYSYQVSDWLKLGMDSRLAIKKNNLVPGGLWEFLIRMNPLEDPYKEDGLLKETVGLEQYLNPLWTYKDGYFIDKNGERDAEIVLKADVKLSNKLSYSTNFKMGFGNTNRSWYYDRLSMPQLGGTSEAGIRNVESFNYTWNNIVSYINDFGKHHLNITAAQELQLYNSQVSRMSGGNIPMKELAFYNMKTATDNLDLSSSYSKSTLSSFLGRVQYEYNNKYLFNVAFRADGSSRLADGNKWAYFPSAAAAWRISEESFMQNTEWISNLKLRLSYGEVGNQGIDPYQTQILLESGTYSWGDKGLLTWAPATLANKGLGWEISETINLGFDWGIWNNRLGGAVELYTTKNKDLLLQRQLAGITGFESIWDNIGSTQNKGVEVTINSDIIRSHDLNWNLNLNFSRNWNEITDLPYGDDLGNQWFIGKPINVVYDYVYEGIWQINEQEEAMKYGRTPGEIKVWDNGDFDINANDRRILGQRDPKWMTSLISNLRYKQWDFSFVVNSMGGHLISINQIGGAAYNGEKWILSGMSDMWTPINTNAYYPRPQQSNRSHNQSQILSYMKGDHAKVQDISIGYSFDQLTRGLKARVYVEAKNAFYLYRACAKERTIGKQVHPEVGSIERTLPTTFVFGINLTL